MSDPQLQRAYLKAMGIQVWERRSLPLPQAAAPVAPAAPVVEVKKPKPRPQVVVPETAPQPVAEPVEVNIPDAAHLDWKGLEAAVSGCQSCGLHEGRNNTVFGVGDREANWLVIGEAPGRDEDLQGEPFVGRAGQLLNAMLLATGLQREQVFIANILKCRPPNNRDPRPEEALCCRPYLERQIELVKPQIILAVGRIAAQNLLKTTQPIGRLRGRVHQLPDSDIPVVVTYHPAYLLRSPGEKAKAWQDLLLALSQMN